jgi:hypothetical protein
MAIDLYAVGFAWRQTNCSWRPGRYAGHSDVATFPTAAAPMAIVSKWLGHPTITITNDTYSHEAGSVRGLGNAGVDKQGPLAQLVELRTFNP